MDGRIKNVEIVKDCAHYDDVLDDDIGFREKAGVTLNKTCSGEARCQPLLNIRSYTVMREIKELEVWEGGQQLYDGHDVRGNGLDLP